MLSPTLHTHDFEGGPLVTLTWKDRPIWIARHIGVRLGYSHGGKRLPNKILGAWSEDFIEGQDYALLTGEELEALKALTRGGPAEIADSARRGLLVLFESGLHMVLLKTRHPSGRRLRRFLVAEVLPKLARTGRYEPEVPAVVPDLAQRREARLLRQAEAREQWVQLSDRKLQVTALHRTADRFRDTLPRDVQLTLELAAAEIATGRNLSALKPETERWVSPTEIAQKWGVSVQKVGRVISALNVREDDRYSKRILNKAKTHDRTVISYLYNTVGEALIEDALRRAGLSPQVT